MMVYMKLTSEQEAWLTAHIQSGEFSSAEDALAHLIDERIAEEAGDLSWARPLVEEAEASYARGEFLTLDEHLARTEARFAAYRSAPRR